MEDEKPIVPQVDEGTPNPGIEEPTGGQEKSVDEGKPTPTPIEKPKTFTQEQVNKIMRSRLERDRLSFLNRYGVKDRDGLDSLIGKAQSYDIMKERYIASKTKISELEERLAFMSNGINPDREDDIRAYFKGKGLEFNEEALINALETHPEWRKVVESDNKPKTTIEVFGVDHKDRNIPETETEKMNRIFGL